jgi:dTDP-glucose pyrophosphorylase
MKNILISAEISIKKAMKKLNETAEKCLLVVDENNHLLGTLTDGDIRRAILNGNQFSSPIQNFYNDKPVTLSVPTQNKSSIKKTFLAHKMDLIPVVDVDNVVVDYFTWESVFGNGNSRKNVCTDVPVVIMAGGKGTRLEPFTKVLPKALVPINEKPIIEHIIQRFTDVGCKEFHITINYKARVLKAYFDELAPEYSVSFVNEPQPLGTAGSLKFLDGKLDKPFFVTNCDIIIKADYDKLYRFHRMNEFDLTLVASTKEYIIPYGTCELSENGHLSQLNEKPSYEFLINTGLYVVNPSLLSILPKNKFYHITNLIEHANKEGKKIGVFPVDDDAWFDIGQWAEYKKTIATFTS